MVYVLSASGKPLMPTEDHRQVRLLLKRKKAVIVRRTPFVIQLVNRVHNYTQRYRSALMPGQNTSASVPLLKTECSMKPMRNCETTSLSSSPQEERHVM